MTWFDLSAAALTLLALTALVGGGVAWAVGLRGFWIPAAAPAFTLTVIAGAAIVAPWVSVGWSVVPVLALAAFIAVPAGLIRRVLRRRANEPSRSPVIVRRLDVWLLVAIVLACGTLAVRFIQIVGEPEAISQTFDNVFHLNGVRFVLDTGNASSLHLGYMTSPSGSLAFYPAAWHATASLLVQLTGVSIPAASNALALVASGVFWPLSVLLFTRSLFGRGPVLTVASGAVAASVPAFPILLYDYGVLLPLLLGLSVLPFALAVVARMLRVTPRVPPLGWGWWLLIAAGAIAGMTLAHPGAFVALVALSVPMVLTWFARAFRSSRSLWRRSAVIGLFVVYLGAGIILLDVLRPPLEARLWPLSMSMTDALLTIITVSPWYQVPAVIVASAAVAGTVWALIDRSRPALIALGMYVIGAWLFVVVASLPFPDLRDAFTGSWYNNLPRLAAIFAISLVPLAAYGVSRTGHWLTARAPVRALAPRVRVVVVAVVGALLFVGAQVGAPQRAVEWAGAGYRDSPTAPLLDVDERALLERLDENVRDGTVVAGNPFTGAALAYAVSGQRVLQPHTLVEMTADKDRVVAALESGRIDPAACRALEHESVRYVLDFGTVGVHGPVVGYALADSDDVRLVDEEGDARLYEITSCPSG